VKSISATSDYKTMVDGEVMRLLASGGCYDGISPNIVIAVALENIANNYKSNCMQYKTNKDDYINLLTF
jgi:hypothetical protein